MTKAYLRLRLTIFAAALLAYPVIAWASLWHCNPVAFALTTGMLLWLTGLLEKTGYPDPESLIGSWNPGSMAAMLLFVFSSLLTARLFETPATPQWTIAPNANIPELMWASGLGALAYLGMWLWALLVPHATRLPA